MAGYQELARDFAAERESRRPGLPGQGRGRGRLSEAERESRRPGLPGQGRGRGRLSEAERDRILAEAISARLAGRGRAATATATATMNI